jgi:hypothetical protein
MNFTNIQHAAYGNDSTEISTDMHTSKMLVILYAKQPSFFTSKNSMKKKTPAEMDSFIPQNLDQFIETNNKILRKFMGNS